MIKSRNPKAKRVHAILCAVEKDCVSSIYSVAQGTRNTDLPAPTGSEFQSSPTKITGTFLTSTGDYRFLEGVFDGEKIRLSTFDGSHAYLVIADFNPQNKVPRISNGVFYSGLNNKEFWNASFNPKAALPDAEKLTFLKSAKKFAISPLKNTI